MLSHFPPSRIMRSSCLLFACLLITVGESRCGAQTSDPLFGRHVVAIFSRLGCNAGTCHGAVQGKNGFRLSLFGANPGFDYEQLVRDQAGRRIDRVQAENSLLLLKGTGRVPHGGGRVMLPDSREYGIVRDWLAVGMRFEPETSLRIVRLAISPPEQTLKAGESYRLRVEARFADGTSEVVTHLCAYQSLDPSVAAVDSTGQVTAMGVGDASILVRYRDEPASAMALVTRDSTETFPEVATDDFVDIHVLNKLRQLGIPPSEECDDATFLRRARLDVTGRLPTPEEVRDFLADSAPDKRTRKIDQLIQEPGYAALWTLKFSDLLGASDFGIYADGLAEHFEAPRFQAWVRARLMENLPYDEFAARIIGATSREGRSLEEWSQEVIDLQAGYTTPRTDLELYARRKTLDIYWQRRDATGVAGAMQVAHTFLGLRLQCAQCHRHPHDVWQQDDLLSFANFFMRVRRVGFEGDNEKKFPVEAARFKELEKEGKGLLEEAKKLKEGKLKELAEQAKNAEQERTRLRGEIVKLEKFADNAEELEAKRLALAAAEQVIAEHKAVQQEATQLERKGRMLSDDVAKRVLHAGIFHRTDEQAQKTFASVESPLGKQSSSEYRLLGEREAAVVSPSDDPREQVIAWLRRPDNPFFARAIVNRIWAHYFGRGLIDPPDDLSPFNPCTHPALLEQLTRRFIEANYDLKWLHRTILNSRTYQLSSQATPANESDRTNYSHFPLRRLPAEVLLDAINQVTETREDFGMKYFHWPENLLTVDIPYMSQNPFVTFVLEQFGRSERNSSAQCDCQRQSEASLLQVLSLANHPRVWQKIADPQGRVMRLAKQNDSNAQRIEELYLAALGRLPDQAELAACEEHLREATYPESGLQAVLWSLLNTKEFLLQH